MKKIISVFLAICLCVAVLPLAVMPFAGEAAVEGRVITITRNGVTLATTYNTFQAAYNASTAGDIINLPAGDYVLEPSDVTLKQARVFNLSKAVTIKGASDGVTRFCPSASWNPDADLQQKMFCSSGNDMVLENITIDCEGKAIDGLYTKTTNLVFKNTIIKDSMRSMINIAGGTAIADGLYVYTPETEISTSRSFAHVDLTGGTITFNSGNIHGALKVDGGTMVNNSAGLVKISALYLFTTYEFYMSPSFAAVAYSACSYTIRSKVDSALKNDASILANTASYYEGISNREISGNDVFGLSHADVLAKLVTLAGKAGSANTDSKNRLSAVVSKITAIKANGDNKLSALTYTDGTDSAGVAGYNADTSEYNIVLPYEYSPTASITLAGTLNNSYGQIISLGNVTLADGIGSASATVWAYAANPQIRTYKVNFTVPKYTVNFLSGANGAIEGTTQYSSFHGTLLSSLALPVCTPKAGYLFDCWSPVLPDSITASESYTACFKRENTVVIPELPTPSGIEVACGFISGDTAATAAVLLAPEGGSVKILDSVGVEISSEAPIATGMTVRLTQGDETVVEYTVVITGDVFGDGIVNYDDFDVVLDAAVGAAELTDAQREAADINGDSVIDAFDAMVADLCGSGNLSAEQFSAYTLGK